MSEGGLTHIGDDGRARMVDVGSKAITRRTATATGVFESTPHVIALVAADDLPKADVLATARLAGIQAAKHTATLIPLAHVLTLSSVTIDFELNEASITITATAKVTGRTGVELEALTAVAIAGLTLHDMTKAVDPHSVLTGIRLTGKSGGKTAPAVLSGVATVLVVSSRAAAGTREDATGPVIAEWLRERGYDPKVVITADADVAGALADAVAAGPAVIVTTGGTGVSPTDRTPEATREVLDRELPGVAEAIRARGLDHTPTAALSRGLAGTAGGTLVVNLPGSKGGVADGLAVLAELLPHLTAQIAGDDDHG